MAANDIRPQQVNKIETTPGDSAFHVVIPFSLLPSALCSVRKLTEAARARISLDPRLGGNSHLRQNGGGSSDDTTILDDTDSTINEHEIHGQDEVVTDANIMDGGDHTDEITASTAGDASCAVVTASAARDATSTLLVQCDYHALLATITPSPKNLLPSATTQDQTIST